MWEVRPQSENMNGCTKDNAFTVDVIYRTVFIVHDSHRYANAFANRRRKKYV